MLRVPDVWTGNAGLDEVVGKAWLGAYEGTAEMLSELRGLRGSMEEGELGCMARCLSEPDEYLQGQVNGWRTRRHAEFGKSYLVEG